MEYKYITEEAMKTGYFTVLTPEMFEEADRYNSEICISRIKKRHLLELIAGLLGANLVMIFMAVFMAGATLKAQTQMHLFLILAAGCIYFLISIVRQFFKKEINVPVNTILPFFFLIANRGFAFVIVFNCVVSVIARQKLSQLKERKGYPHFVSLVIDSKERKKNEDGTFSTHYEKAYENQKSGQTADFEEISVPEITLTDMSSVKKNDYFDGV